MTMSPNPELGEIAIELGRDTFVLRSSYDCIHRIESGTGKEMSEIHKHLVHDGAIGVADLRTIVANGITAGGGTAPADLGQRIYEQGVLKVASEIIVFLTNALVGPNSLKAMSTEDPETNPDADAMGI